MTTCIVGDDRNYEVLLNGKVIPHPVSFSTDEGWVRFRLPDGESFGPIEQCHGRVVMISSPVPLQHKDIAAAKKSLASMEEKLAAAPDEDTGDLAAHLRHQIEKLEKEGPPKPGIAGCVMPRDFKVQEMSLPLTAAAGLLGLPLGASFAVGEPEPFVTPPQVPDDTEAAAHGWGDFGGFPVWTGGPIDCPVADDDEAD